MQFYVLLMQICVTANANLCTTNADLCTANADLCTANADLFNTNADLCNTNADLCNTNADLCTTYANLWVDLTRHFLLRIDLPNVGLCSLGSIPILACLDIPIQS